MSIVDREGLAREIYDRTHLTGEFVLRSGAVSNEYFDKYLFESDPVLLRSVGDALVPLVPDGTEVLAGLELGGIPLATMLSQLTGLPRLFVRKEAKTYGTCRLAEGGEVDGRRLTIVEDVVTSGGQVILSTQDLRERGAIVEHAVIVIDRRGPDHQRQLADAGIDVHALFTMDELKRGAGSANERAVSPETARELIGRGRRADANAGDGEQVAAPASERQQVAGIPAAGASEKSRGDERAKRASCSPASERPRGGYPGSQ